MTAREDELRLGRTPGWATATTAFVVGIGVILAIRGARGSPYSLVAGLLLVVAGILGYARAVRPWFLDATGLSLAGNRRLLWADVTRIQVLATNSQRAGKETARVNLVIETPRRNARLLLASRKDAAKVSALLAARLPADVDGRDLLWRVTDAWAHTR